MPQTLIRGIYTHIPKQFKANLFKKIRSLPKGINRSIDMTTLKENFYLDEIKNLFSNEYKSMSTKNTRKPS